VCGRPRENLGVVLDRFSFAGDACRFLEGKRLQQIHLLRSRGHMRNFPKNCEY
jgi:hypothetical protein